MKDPIYILLEKLAQGTIQAKEWKQLRDVLPTLSDAVISDILENIWLTYQYQGNKSAQKFEELNKIIQHERKKKRHRARYGRIFPYVGILGILSILLWGGVWINKQKNKSASVAALDLKVVVARGEKATIELPDGTTVKLNAESQLSYPANFGIKTRTVKLMGEGFFQVKKSQETPFIVSTPALNIEVLGTTFQVSAYAESNLIETSLFEGSLAVYNETMDQQVLKPNEKAVYNIENGNLTINPCQDFDFETDWMQGNLIFRSQPLQDVFSEIGRYYGYKLKINESELLQDRFSGSFEKRHVYDILNTLRYHYNFQYQVESDTIHINF